MTSGVPRPRISRADEHSADDRLLSPADVNRIYGLNIKAVRDAMRSGLRHIRIGNGEKPFLRTTPRWFREWLESTEQSAILARRATQILEGSADRARRSHRHATT